MMLIHAWAAFMALILPALCVDTIVIPASTVTVTETLSISVPAWTATVTGPTVTLFANLDCLPTPTSSLTPSTSSLTPLASSAIPMTPSLAPSTSSVSLPPGFTCPADGALVNVMSGSVTLWPCGTPDPTDSITIIPGESTFTVVPTEDSTTEVWVTDTQLITASDYVTSVSTSTFWITTTESVTVLTSTSSSTLFMGTSTISDGYSEPASSSQVTPSKSTPVTTPSTVMLPSSRSTTVKISSQASPSHSSSHRPVPTGWGSYGWNSSTPAMSPQASSNATGITGGVTVSPHSVSVASTPVVTTHGPGNFTVVTGGVTVHPYTHSTPKSTHVITRNFTVSLDFGNTTTVKAATMTSFQTKRASSMLGSQVTAVPSPQPTSSMPAICEEGCDFGNFTLEFEEDHAFNSNATEAFVPLRSPNHHLLFNQGFVYVPAGYKSMRPASGSHLAVYLPNRTMATPTHAKYASLPSGAIGAGGDCIINSAFHFNAYGGFFGCNKNPMPVGHGPAPVNCSLEVSGFRWDAAQMKEDLQAISIFHLEPCGNATVEADGRCSLKEINFADQGSNFTDLSSIRFKSYYWTTAEEDRAFFMDNLHLGWADDSVEAASIRHDGI